MQDLRDIALYVHWPFCVSKCPYCDFNSHVRADVDEAAWQSALLRDLAHEAALLPDARLTSIFFGGGTPSLMPPALVARLIDAATTHWPVSTDIEITLEANPSSVEAARFADLARAGVNRVSLGIQSFSDDALAFLGRAHGVNEALSALTTAQTRFGRVNFDLIYTLPGQTLAEWENDLSRALALGTDHLSLYQLTIEPGTRFATMVAQGQFEPTEPDLAADFFDLTRSTMANAGLPAYEISNHARPGSESRHNLTYWRYGTYAGIGPGAHGRRDGLATVRHKKPENWLAAVDRNGHGLQSEDALTAEEQAREALVMGLRLTEGVNLERIARQTGVEQTRLLDPPTLATLVGHRLVKTDGSIVRLSETGFPVLDRVLAEIVAI